MGSAAVLSMDKVLGSLEVGKKADLLVVNVSAASGESSGSVGVVDCFSQEDPLERFQKWLYLGDDRNIAAVYVSGRHVL